MKIRKISLENLNSLVGEHLLDLTAEPIASAGIFAITGPDRGGEIDLVGCDHLGLVRTGGALWWAEPGGHDEPAPGALPGGGRIRGEW